MNCLDNKLSGGLPAPVQLATDLRAANATYESFPVNIPIQAMNWGLLAKADAVHHPHMDRGGTATFVCIEDGLKKWDLGFPKECAEEELATPDAYGYGMTNGRNYSRQWEWYSVLLHPGTML